MSFSLVVVIKFAKGLCLPSLGCAALLPGLHYIFVVDFREQLYYSVILDTAGEFGNVQPKTQHQGAEQNGHSSDKMGVSTDMMQVISLQEKPQCRLKCNPSSITQTAILAQRITDAEGNIDAALFEPSRHFFTKDQTLTVSSGYGISCDICFIGKEWIGMSNLAFTL
jgi:hypothetical protein